VDWIVGLECRAPGCGRRFWLCRKCYRGQRYCSEPCRERGYRECGRARQRRYRRRFEVRRRQAQAAAKYRASHGAGGAGEPLRSDPPAAESGGGVPVAAEQEIFAAAHFVIYATLPAVRPQQYEAARCERCGRMGQPFLPQSAARAEAPP
jgi:hypothetical protein